MSVDRRAGIIEQCLRLLKALTVPLSNGTVMTGNIVHNRNELPAEMVPGIILLDGDEQHDQAMVRRAPGRQQTIVAPSLVRMTPEIYVVLDVRKPANTDVGEDLNIARMLILKTLLTDKTLQILVGANGEIVYDGTVTDLARNRTMQGQLGMSVTFVYPLFPGELD